MRINGLLAGVLMTSIGFTSFAHAADPLVAEILDAGVTRFHKNAEAQRLALPSLALLKPMKGRVVNSAGVALKPEFSEVEGKTRTVISIPEGTSLYGTGEVAGPLLRNGKVVTTWNTDAYGYQDDAKSLYQSHPWVLAVRPDGTAFGILADTTYRCEIDLTKNISFTAEGASYPVIIIERSNPMDVVKELAELTGKIPMPPRWAIGYHQCRYSYFPEVRVAEVARNFRERKIPCDTIWLDIDYMDGFRCFTFNKSYFPDPKLTNKSLGSWGFNTVWMIDPGIKAEKGYFAYDQLMAGNNAVLKKDGSAYQGDVWPGACIFPDFTRAETRTWWAGVMGKFVKDNQIGGIWNDMNEPAVFNVKSKTMPEDNVHRPDADILGRPDADASHARFHNVYGMFMVRSTYEGIEGTKSGKRPFVLSRANFIGGQRYAATWTGDNSANWYHLETSIPMVLNLSLSGQPFNGPDIGGFAGNGDGDLFGRWMGFGAMLPFARGHTAKENINKEPWEFGPEVEKTCRQALERRYRLLPYYYTLFWEAHSTGAPICRPVFFADPKDPALRAEDDAFLVGGDLLVAPQVVPDRSRVVALPKAPGNLPWREIDFGDADNKELPKLYLRPGAIVATGLTYEDPDHKDTSKMVVPVSTVLPLSQIELLINLDAEGKAEGKMYSDSGDGMQFQTGKLYRYATYTAKTQGDKVIVKMSNIDGELMKALGPGAVLDRKLSVRLFLGDREVRAEARDGDDIVLPLK